MANKNTVYTAQLDKYGFPVNSPISPGTIGDSEIPWRFGIRQKIQAHKIRASTGQFHNLSGTFSGTTVLTNVTVTSSVVQTGTISNNLIVGGTVTLTNFTNGTAANILSSGGTANNQTMGTPKIVGGTIDGAVFGTPSGTVNPLAYLINGTAGASGSVIYVKTVSPGTTFGTMNFNNGIITTFS
jgi:hypothetical protein